MNSNHRICSDKVFGFDRVTAELASAAYALALNRGVRGSWIELELDLWTAMRETMEDWANARRRFTFSQQFIVPQQGFVAELSERACAVAKRHGVEGPLRRLELSMNHTFQSVFKRAAYRHGLPPGSVGRQHAVLS